MALTFLPGNQIKGLSTDTKPTWVLVGTTFSATDTGAFYVWDGSAWVAAAAVYTTNAPLSYNYGSTTPVSFSHGVLDSGDPICLQPLNANWSGTYHANTQVAATVTVQLILTNLTHTQQVQFGIAASSNNSVSRGDDMTADIGFNLNTTLTDVVPSIGIAQTEDYNVAGATISSNLTTDSYLYAWGSCNAMTSPDTLTMQVSVYSVMEVLGDGSVG